jgi:hypothetical protein
LAHALLNGSCPGPACQTRPIWLFIPPYDNGSTRLSCRHLVRHPASFLSPSCLRLRATHFRQRTWEQVPPPRIRPTPASTPTRAVLLHVQEGVSQHARAIVFIIVERLIRLPGLFPCSSSLTCCPCPWSQPRADRRSLTRVQVSRSCSWLFFVCVAKEDMMVRATLRLS